MRNSEFSTAENTCKAACFLSTSLIVNSVRKQECDALLYLLINCNVYQQIICTRV